MTRIFIQASSIEKSVLFWNLEIRGFKKTHFFRMSWPTEVVIGGRDCIYRGDVEICQASYIYIYIWQFEGVLFTSFSLKWSSLIIEQSNFKSSGRFWTYEILRFKNANIFPNSKSFRPLAKIFTGKSRLFWPGLAVLGWFWRFFSVFGQINGSAAESRGLDVGGRSSAKP